MSQAKWIWFPGEAEKPSTVTLSLDVNLDKPIKSATLKITGDNILKLAWNGKQVLDEGNWSIIKECDITKIARQGQNQIEINAENIDGPAGLVFIMEVTYQDDSTFKLVSDKNCQVINKAGFKAQAQEICAFGSGPWGWTSFKTKKMILE